MIPFLPHARIAPVAAPEEEQALVGLAAVRASIDELDAIAGRLARAVVAHGPIRVPMGLGYLCAAAA